jgi:Flp pilus assembly protein TadD
MQVPGVRSVGRTLFAMAMMALPLMGCSSTGIDAFGAFGDEPLQAADLPNVASYDAARALSEARAHFRVGDFGYSAALYKRYVELTSNDPEGYVGLAASYDRLRRFDLADRVYASLYRLTGGTAQYYNNLGYSYLLRGDTATALINLKKASQLDPQNATIANNLKMLANATSRPAAPRTQT